MPGTAAGAEAARRRNSAGWDGSILSGSANLALLGHVSETLAGRAGYFTLQPMSRRELRRGTSRQPFLVTFSADPSAPSGKADPVSDREVLTGGLPPAALDAGGGAEEWFRDVDLRRARPAPVVSDHQPGGVSDAGSLAAMRTGQVLGVSSLARDAKLNAVTAGR